MKTTLQALAFALALSLVTASGAFAQPSGGPDAKGNAPLKHVHTVNDGVAKAGANSFTQNQAREHIEKSGYTNVSGLTKGQDGVWRGMAMKGGAYINVAMDFKGNVSDGGSPGGKMGGATSTTTTRTADAPVGLMPPATTRADSATTASTTTATSATAPTPAMHHHRHRHHPVKASCAHPSPNGAACSGIDRNDNGISDKEDHAMKAGAKP